MSNSESKYRRMEKMYLLLNGNKLIRIKKLEKWKRKKKEMGKVRRIGENEKNEKLGIKEKNEEIERKFERS